MARHEKCHIRQDIENLRLSGIESNNNSEIANIIWLAAWLNGSTLVSYPKGRGFNSPLRHS